MEGGKDITVAESVELEGILRELRGSNGVVASSVISRDGMPIATDLPPQVNPEMMALRSAFMQGIGELVMESVEEETARTVIIVADLHYILTTAIDDRNILIVVIDRRVEVGGMIPDVLEMAESIRSVLGHP